MLNFVTGPAYLLAFLILLFALLVWLLITTRALRSRMEMLAAQLTLTAETDQNTLAQALQQGLSSLAERNQIALLDHSERLRNGLGGELNQLREVIHQLQLAQSSELAGTRAVTQSALNSLGVSQATELAQNRETLATQLNASSSGLKQAQTEFLGQTLQTLAEQGRAQQVVMQNTMQHISAQLTTVIEGLNATVNTRLGEISGKVTERLDEGFKKTNETFVNVMTRLATIDEAQKKKSTASPVMS